MMANICPAHGSPEDVPLDSPLRTHTKKGLPVELSSTYAFGHISGHPRTPVQQAAFESRSQEILNTMTAAQIDEQYNEVCQEIKSTMARIEQDERMWKKQVDDLKRKREVERRAWKRIKELSQAMADDSDKMQE